MQARRQLITSAQRLAIAPTRSIRPLTRALATPAFVRPAAPQLLPTVSAVRTYANGRRPHPPGGTHRMDMSGEEEKPALEQYGIDLTARARDGKLDPVIGRDAEIQRTIQILSRRTKNNPVLIGNAGTGRLLSSRGWRCASFAAMSLRVSRIRGSSAWTWAPSLPAPSSGATLRRD